MVNSVKVTMQIRHDSASNWTIRNPILSAGEFGLESDTYLIKVGDGVTDWEHLRYLNKLNSTYFQWLSDGSLTFSDSFLNTISKMEATLGEAVERLTVTEPPVEDTDVTNKRYVDEAIRNAGHLKRAVVDTLPDAVDADENTLYMVASGDHYEEYMVIDGAWDMVGTTGDGTAGYELQVATAARLGGVKSSNQPDHISVDADGFMTLNQVSTTLLYVPDGDEFILYGGTA